MPEERDLLNFRQKYATMEDAPEIAPQNMEALTCTSENPRFCKEHLTVRVGLIDRDEITEKIGAYYYG